MPGLITKAPPTWLALQEFSMLMLTVEIQAIMSGIKLDRQQQEVSEPLLGVPSGRNLPDTV